MSKATITLMGLYNWDSDLFKNLYLPDGINKDIVINTILIDGADFEVIYSDPHFIEGMIGLISDKWQRTFQKWYDALQLEYNPIENYDRYEEWSDNGTNTGTVNHDTSHNTDSKGSEKSNGNSSEKSNGSSSENVTESNSEHSTGSSSDQSSSNSQTDTFVSTYDSNALNQDNQSRSTQSANSSGTTGQDTTGSNRRDTSAADNRDTTGTTSNNVDKSELITESGSDNETRNLANSGIHEGHLHGNIGVTTSQQMLESELDLDSWNLYQHIADIFVEELCIMVY